MERPNRRAQAMEGALARLEGLEPRHFPTAACGPAGRAPQPILRGTVEVAGEEVAAWQAAFAIGHIERHDIAAGAGPWILPGHAHVVAGAGHDLGSRRTRISEIDLGRHRFS